MNTYYGRMGTKYTTVQEIGAGGEGTVYTLSGYSGIVAKIYKPERFKSTADRDTMERKLKAMISMNVSYLVDGIARFAWPQDILYEHDVMVGFIMPEIKTKYKIYDMYRGGNNSVREKVYPNYTWKYSVQFAYHLAWLVNYLHSHGIVIGDFNQSNIAIDTNSGTVIIIDCDSFDITDPITGEHFSCGVGLPEMLAPELQLVGDLSKAQFTKQSDYFSLAIHIFRLLMNNADPFGGIITTNASISNIPANQAICNGECVYVRNVIGKKIPEWAPKPSMLPPEFLRLFDKTFNYTALTAMKKIPGRATAAEWCIALGPFGAKEPNAKLKKCSKNPRHVYSAHNNGCPWCDNKSNTTSQATDNHIYKGNFEKKKTTSKASPQKSNGLLWIIIVVILAIGSVALVMYLRNDDARVDYADIDYNPDVNQDVEEYDELNDIESNYEEYIIYDSDSRYIDDSDLDVLSKTEVKLARNEIYARHGRGFKTDWIREYFESTNWYEEQYDPDYFDNNIVNSVFNDFEKRNAKYILEYEKRKGY